MNCVRCIHEIGHKTRGQDVEWPHIIFKSGKKEEEVMKMPHKNNLC